MMLRIYPARAAVNDSRTRPAHRALDGIIRPVDDPFWRTHSPPAGHNCRCRLIQIDAEQAEIRSRDGRGLNQPETPEMQPDEGWGRKPTEWGETLQGLIEKKGNECQAFNFAGKRTGPPIWCDEENYAGIMRLSMEGYMRADGKMPEPRSGAGIERLHTAAPEQLFQRFMQEFGGGKQQEFTSAVGYELLIDSALFRQKRREVWKIQKGERAEWMLHMAAGIKSPDEIWELSDPQSSLDNLYFLTRFNVGRKYLLGCLAVFERQRDALGPWTGVTSYAATRKQSYWDCHRDQERQRLLYWRFRER